MAVRLSGGNVIFSALIKKEVCAYSSHLFYKYFVRQSVCQATRGTNVKIWKCDFSTPISIFCSSYIFLIISNSFATYGCCHPCFNLLHSTFCLYLSFSIFYYLFLQLLIYLTLSLYFLSSLTFSQSLFLSIYCLYLSSLTR